MHEGFTPISTPPPLSKEHVVIYLVQTDWNTYGLASYFPDGSCVGFDEDGEYFTAKRVVAWAKLPEILQAEETNGSQRGNHQGT